MGRTRTEREREDTGSTRERVTRQSKLNRIRMGYTTHEHNFASSTPVSAAAAAVDGWLDGDSLRRPAPPGRPTSSLCCSPAVESDKPI